MKPGLGKTTDFDEEYLPLFNSGGDWIDSPDYLVAIVVTQAKPRENWISVQQAYETMRLEERLNPTGTLSDYSRQLVARREKVGSDRMRAGLVALELVRLAAATGKPPSVSAARRVAAFRLRQESWNTEPASLLRAMERSYSSFRDTVHLQAASVLRPLLQKGIWRDETGLREFLGLARAFEAFIDRNVASRNFKWSPLRIPVEIAAIDKINFQPLTDEELRAAFEG